MLPFFRRQGWKSKESGGISSFTHHRTVSTIWMALFVAARTYFSSFFLESLQKKSDFGRFSDLLPQSRLPMQLWRCTVVLKWLALLPELTAAGLCRICTCFPFSRRRQHIHLEEIWTILGNQNQMQRYDAFSYLGK